MGETTADILARMHKRYPGTVTFAASPVTARRKRGDSPAPATGDSGSALQGTREAYGSHPMQRIKRPGTGGPARFRPNAKFFAGALPATTVPNAPRMTPVSGRRIDGPATVMRKGRRVPSDALLQARANSADAGVRAWVAARTNTERDAGDVLPAGSHYPGGRRRSPRY